MPQAQGRLGLRPKPHEGRCPSTPPRARPWNPSVGWGVGGGSGCGRRTGDRRFDARNRPPLRTPQPKEEFQRRASGGGPGGKAPWRGLGRSPGLPSRHEAAGGSALGGPRPGGKPHPGAGADPGGKSIQRRAADRQGGGFLADEVPLEVRGQDHPWVSRGGLKLDHGLRHFGLSPAGLVCLDVGASTGGFTDVLLAHGAARVHAVDVGHGQLAWRLRTDPRVVVHERTNARYLDRLGDRTRSARWCAMPVSSGW